MRIFERLVRGLCKLGLGLSALALLVSLALIGFAVFKRYVLGAPVPWTDELVGYLLVISVMLAAGDALLGDEHIGVDIVTEKLSARGKHIAFLLGIVAVLVVSLMLLIEGYGMVSFSHMVGLRSNGYLATPMWIPELFVPIGAVLLVLAAIVAFVIAVRDRNAQHKAPEIPQGIE
jgi:C4-dicarboxylate transporter, DctQ subunit